MIIDNSGGQIVWRSQPIHGRNDVRNQAIEQELEERLVRYCRIDTQSDESSSGSPSTARQLDLSRLLVEELEEIGASDVTLTGFGAVVATVPGSAGVDAPAIGFLAHVDTSPDFSGTDVKPLVHREYDGADIRLPDDPDQVLSPPSIPALANRAGETIVTASGRTLLGADDKAGVAIVMAMANRLVNDQSIPHGPVRVCFTPDEEIGRGVHPDLPDILDVAAAYTLDGGLPGEVVHETFSANKAVVRIEGVSIHPGDAKDVMVNALHLGSAILSALPADEKTPETTDGRAGFLHAYSMTGTAAALEIHFILRAFELDELESHGALLQSVCAGVAAAEPRAKISCEITPQYRNMRYWLENDMRPVEIANEACRQLGLTPVAIPTRGGTDGSRLTEMGLPCPNLFTGMQELHGPLEWVSIQDMVKATDVCVRIVELWATPIGRS
jgi:tripeptide aminopeptidase